MSKNNAMRYHAGLSAERIVARRYLRRGAEFLQHRWRGRGGEIDLIFRENGEFVFVEVKSSKSHERAAQRLGRRQVQRIMRAASEYAAQATGVADNYMRFDVATVNNSGDVRVLENALVA